MTTEDEHDYESFDCWCMPKIVIDEEDHFVMVIHNDPHEN